MQADLATLIASLLLLKLFARCDLLCRCGCPNLRQCLPRFGANSAASDSTLTAVPCAASTRRPLPLPLLHSVP